MKSGQSMIGMLLSVIIIGILLGFVVPQYLGTVKPGSKELGGGSAITIQKTAAEKVNAINEMQKKQAEEYKKYQQ